MNDRRLQELDGKADGTIGMGGKRGAGTWPGCGSDPEEGPSGNR